MVGVGYTVVSYAATVKSGVADSLLKLLLFLKILFFYSVEAGDITSERTFSESDLASETV